MKRKLSNGLYMNKIYRGYQSEEAIVRLFKSEDNEIRNARQLYFNKIKHYTEGEVVNGYRFVKEFEHFNQWEKLDSNGKRMWRTSFYKNETPAPYDKERYKEGDLSIENLSREEHHEL